MSPAIQETTEMWEMQVIRRWETSPGFFDLLKEISFSTIWSTMSSFELTSSRKAWKYWSEYHLRELLITLVPHFSLPANLTSKNSLHLPRDSHHQWQTRKSCFSASLSIANIKCNSNCEEFRYYRETGQLGS